MSEGMGIVCPGRLDRSIQGLALPHGRTLPLNEADLDGGSAFSRSERTRFVNGPFAAASRARAPVVRRRFERSAGKRELITR